MWRPRQFEITPWVVILLFVFITVVIARCMDVMDTSSGGSKVSTSQVDSQAHVPQLQVPRVGFGVRGNIIYVIWTRPGPEVTQYRVQWIRATEDWPTGRQINGTTVTTETSNTITNLSTGSYRIRVQAITNGKDSPWSRELIADIPGSRP